MSPRQITYADTFAKISWRDAVEAIRAGHRLPKAQVSDMFLGPANATLLSRGAYIEGLGYGVKSVTVFDANPQIGLPTVQGSMVVFEPESGQPEAIIESKLVTELKTAADSVLGALFLARPDSRQLLIIGAGTVARSLIAAYSALFPDLEGISVWARRIEQSQDLCAEFAGHHIPVTAAADLPSAVANADIISSATMAREPVLLGDWVRNGTHVDLIGAYKKDMREADDTLIAKACLFVDSRATTLGHIGELVIPMERGVITADHIKGDLYDLVAGGTARETPDQITMFKNGGGAHLDLMIARYLSTLA